MVQTIEIQGFPHAYELSEPTDSPLVLVFVHGWLLSRAYWQPVIDQLSPAFPCLTYDLRGFGESQPNPSTVGFSASSGSNTLAGDALGSPAPTPILSEPSSIVTIEKSVEKSVEKSSVSVAAKTAADLDWALAASPCLSQYNPAAYARDLGLLLQQLGIRQAWLIGHSLGGTIALWAADQSPETVVGVICVNSGGGIYLKEEFERFRTAGQVLVKFRPRWLSYLPLLDLPLTRMNVARPLSAGWGKQRLMDLVAAQPDAALGTLMESTTEAEVHQLPQVVARLQQPVHFIAGANDTLMEPKYVRHLASFHPSFEYCGNNVSEISDCGHLSMVEQPEAVAAQISAILAKHQA